jgi:hypothetical protein
MIYGVNFAPGSSSERFDIVGKAEGNPPTSTFRSVADIDRQWMRIKQQQQDFIKMILVYSEERGYGWSPPTGSDRYGLDYNRLPRHIVQLAHHDKLRVSAHVESAGDFEVAVAVGVDIIAHMPGFWPDAQRIASKGVGIYEIKDEFAKCSALFPLTQQPHLPRPVSL